MFLGDGYLRYSPNIYSSYPFRKDCISLDPQLKIIRQMLRFTAVTGLLILCMNGTVQNEEGISQSIGFSDERIIKDEGQEMYCNRTA